MPKSRRSRSTQARIYRPTPRNLALLARALQAGEVVGVPSETVYGLAGNALEPQACAKIFRAKGRPTTDPLIVHLASMAQLDAVAESSAAAKKLAAKFWPGPLTLVLPKRPHVPDLVTAGLSSVAVRVPAHPLFRKLIKLAGVPLAAPSANPFGYVSPTSAAHVRDGLGRKIRHILDGGACPIGVESTIVDLRDPASPRLLRPGAISQRQLESALGVPLTISDGAKRGAQVAPGLLKRHYSPRKPTSLHEKFAADAPTAHPREAWVYFQRPKALSSAKNVFWLSATGDTHEAARALFRMLRQLDASRFRAIHVEHARGDDLAAAINDRLRRAAAK